ncbi:type I restriction endonuclease [Allofranklinella schreckenbergeri]|uniref:Type I restriction endonuclease n=1 Tax=Allofranklinella schreckenbergeri TaxID=1076744 RepID=A0A3M6R6U9_9BURK|nr:type I restriction endonuclease [Allofranklinella schreckenbergeri]RMX10590.1 type I restriction endonuclease [Allofranklinella schreckenbergeri]
MAFLSEAEVEQTLLAQLEALGYGLAREEEIGPDGRQPERDSYADVVLHKRFEAAVARLNPGLPEEVRADAVRQVLQSQFPALLEENRRLCRLVTGGLCLEEAATAKDFLVVQTAGKHPVQRCQ